MEKSIAATSKSHQTILKFYTHFSEQTEEIKKSQFNQINDIECQIKELSE